MSKSNKSDVTSKVILILGILILIVGIAILIRLVFYSPLPVQAPGEDMQMEMQDDMPDQPLNGQDIQQEEQLEQAPIQN